MIYPLSDKGAQLLSIRIENPQKTNKGESPCQEECPDALNFVEGIQKFFRAELSGINKIMIEIPCPINPKHTCRISAEQKMIG